MERVARLTNIPPPYQVTILIMALPLMMLAILALHPDTLSAHYKPYVVASKSKTEQNLKAVGFVCPQPGTDMEASQDIDVTKKHMTEKCQGPVTGEGIYAERDVVMLRYTGDRVSGYSVAQTFLNMP